MASNPTICCRKKLIFWSIDQRGQLICQIYNLMNENKKNVIISDLLTLSFHISLIIIIIQIYSQWSRQLLLFGDKLYLQANDWFLRLRYIPTAATNCTYLIYRSVHWLQRYASQVNSSQNDVITIQGFTKSKFSLKIECCYFTDMIFAK